MWQASVGGIFKQCDGPTSRLVLMSRHAALGPLVTQLMNYQINEDWWLRR